MTDAADPFGNLITTLGVAFDESMRFTPHAKDCCSGVEEGKQSRPSLVTVFLMIILLAFVH